MASRTWVSLFCIFLAVIAVYAKVTRAYYCGYDDFLEINRAAFEDKHDPSRIFTTTHFDTSKYRPLSRSLSFVTYWAGGGNPLFYRLRNLIFHLLSVAAVYGLGLALFRSWSVAVAAASLFGLHPLANQTVTAAVFTITASDFMMLSALLCFVYALESKRWRLRWLVLTLAITWISLFLYEASITIFAFLYGYLGLEWLRRRPLGLSRRFYTVLAAGSVLILTSFFAARLANVSIPAHRVPIPVIAKNAVLNGGVLVLPFDLMFAHKLLGTPLPPDIHGMPAGPLLLLVIGALAVLAAVIIVRRKQLPGVDWPRILFLCGVIGCSLVPFLFFNPHPSETYLHFSAAIYSLILAAVLRGLFQGTLAYAAVIVTGIVLFGTATWIRNESVANCGSIAQRIAEGLPAARWREGIWDIRLAPFPGEPVTGHYGVYEYHGVAAIDMGDPTLPGAKDLLQILSRNEKLTARVVPPAEIRDCPPYTCFWVHADGTIVEARGPQAGQ